MKLYNCTIQQLSVHRSLIYRCVFQYYIVYFLFYDVRKCYRVQLWIATKIYFFSSKQTAIMYYYAFTNPRHLPAEKGLQYKLTIYHGSYFADTTLTYLCSPFINLLWETREFSCSIDNLCYELKWKKEEFHRVL